MTAPWARSFATESAAIPEWYARLPVVRQLPPIWRPNPRLFLTMVPVLAFYALSKVASAEVAIVGGFAVFTVVFLLTRTIPLLQFVATYGYAINVGAALVGLALGSEKAYLAAGPVSDLLIIPVYAYSIARGWPLIGALGKEIALIMFSSLPVNAPIFVRLTLAWAVYEAIQVLVLTWMLLNLSIGEYLIWGRIFGAPTTVVMIAVSGTLVIRAAHRAERTNAPAALPAGNSIGAAG